MEKILEYLARHRGDFYGSEWRPRDILLAGHVQKIYSDAYQFYLDMLDLPLHLIPNGATLLTWRKEVRWALEEARKRRQLDHAVFIEEIGVVYHFGKRILRALRRAEISDQLS